LLEWAPQAARGESPRTEPGKRQIKGERGGKGAHRFFASVPYGPRKRQRRGARGGEGVHRFFAGVHVGFHAHAAVLGCRLLQLHQKAQEGRLCIQREDGAVGGGVDIWQQGRGTLQDNEKGIRVSYAAFIIAHGPSSQYRAPPHLPAWALPALPHVALCYD